MHITPLVAIVVATWTWVSFGVCMKYYFRFSGRTTAAKSWLVLSAYACTLLQMVFLAIAGRPSPVLGWAGLTGFALANVLFWWALAAHGRRRPAFAFVPVPPVSFTTAGPYRFIRHPIYSAYLVGWLGGVALAQQPWLLLPVAWMWLLYNRAARQEEQSFLGSSFAAAYQDYRGRTGRFLPRWSYFLPLPFAPSRPAR
jgi:protein-S-isoprenylcysteine O-methyltransferase Ste14